MAMGRSRFASVHFLSSRENRLVSAMSSSMFPNHLFSNRGRASFSSICCDAFTVTIYIYSNLHEASKCSTQ